ncbi:hypothetical protein CPB84DRAFT_1745977 [Gymnopilus junonius]|uniref:Uncharacterized protein n=1 Tax=Gymnopilus junonius TaxID=109634 RepID=A0A9P5TPS9_GYMJU|nr:hypothetical protein CPB84DRAFT_1745977 [Gymnopilus junonius]
MREAGRQCRVQADLRLALLAREVRGGGSVKICRHLPKKKFFKRRGPHPHWWRGSTHIAPPSNEDVGYYRLKIGSPSYCSGWGPDTTGGPREWEAHQVCPRCCLPPFPLPHLQMSWVLSRQSYCSTSLASKSEQKAHLSCHRPATSLICKNEAEVASPSSHYPYCSFNWAGVGGGLAGGDLIMLTSNLQNTMGDGYIPVPVPHLARPSDLVLVLPCEAAALIPTSFL